MEMVKLEPKQKFQKIQLEAEAKNYLEIMFETRNLNFETLRLNLARVWEQLQKNSPVVDCFKAYQNEGIQVSE